MRDDLLGYLLGALEPHEMRRVERWLQEDPTARKELAAIEQLLRPLERMPLENEPPPAGLIERTLAQLPPVETPTPAVPQLPRLRRGVEPPQKRSYRSGDWACGAIAAAVLLCLLIPALTEGRFAARRAVCQDHLRQFGTAITEFVMLNQQHRLPPLAAHGPEAFAGMYAVRLFEAGLLHRPAMRWCPSLEPPEPSGLWFTPELGDGFAEFDTLLVSNQLHDLPPDDLAHSQRYAGGHYAYLLGTVVNGRYVTPRYEGRSTFALMSDAPNGWFMDGSRLQQLIGHDGRGINILYEDGSVRFAPVDALWSMPDHPLLNDRGDVEAGVNADDAVLGSSWRGPFIGAPQR